MRLKLSEEADIFSWMIYTTGSLKGNARIIKKRPPIASSDHFMDWRERSHLLCYIYIYTYILFYGLFNWLSGILHAPVMDVVSMTYIFCHRAREFNKLGELGSLSQQLEWSHPENVGQSSELTFPVWITHPLSFTSKIRNTLLLVNRGVILM